MERTRADWVDFFRWASDEMLRSPLWEYPPNARPQMLSERRRRGLLLHDDEPIGDPEYA